jgi:hypothetical protein
VPSPVGASVGSPPPNARSIHVASNVDNSVELGDLAVGRDRGADCRSDHIGNRAPEVPRIGGDVTTRKGKLRPAPRRTSETVVRTHAVVITAHAEGGRVASTRPEVDR